MKGWFRFCTRAMVGLMAVNIIAAACYFLLQERVRKLRQPVVAEAGSAFPAFSGIDVAGARWKARDVPCRVIRVTDDKCSYCRKDKPSYAAFLDAARSASCEVIELSARAGQMAEDPRPGVVQLEFIDTDVGPALFPFATPHTVILDNAWSIQWNRRGMFDEESLEAGIAVVRELAAKPMERVGAGLTDPRPHARAGSGDAGR